MERKSIRLSFANNRGQNLAAILDTPITPPRFYGVFAPCFTCTKESHGAAKICRALAERGIAMLRFDIAGLGESDGHISELNFTRRVEDILSAVNFVQDHYASPQLLIGHSLSGTAVLSAAHHLPQVRALATVGSPADPSRVIEKFRRQNLLTDIDDHTVHINVLGQIIPFKRGFVDDMLAQNVANETARITQKLFIFHAPNDTIVSADEAKIIEARATGDCSRVMLDPAATHLFETRKDDAEFIASTLSAWFK